MWVKAAGAFRERHAEWHSAVFLRGTCRPDHGSDTFVALTAGFIFFFTTSLLEYLRQRYGEQYDKWAEKTKKSVPLECKTIGCAQNLEEPTSVNTESSAVEEVLTTDAL